MSKKSGLWNIQRLFCAALLTSSILACRAPSTSSTAAIDVEAGYAAGVNAVILRVGPALDTAGTEFWLNVQFGGTTEALVYVDRRVGVKSQEGRVVGTKDLRIGDSIRLWLKPLTVLTQPAKSFADSLQVIGSRKP